MSGANDQGIGYVLMEQEAKAREAQEREDEYAESLKNHSSEPSPDVKSSRGWVLWMLIGVLLVILFAGACCWMLFSFLKVPFGMVVFFSIVGYVFWRLRRS